MRAAAWFLTLALVPAAATAALAGAFKVAPDGTVHTVRSETWQSMESPSNDQPPASGTMLRYTRQDPDGTKTNWLIPGTDERATDREPALALRAGGNQPFVIWSRSEDAVLELFVTTLVDDQWTPLRRVFAGAGNRRLPDIEVRGHWLHVSWVQDTAAGPVFMRGVLDPDGLVEVHGPELLPTDGEESLVSPQGEAESGVSAEPDPQAIHLSGLVSPPTPGEGGTIYIWGVRDEPIPITYLQGFRLPAGLTDVSRIRTRWLGNRLVLSFQSGGALYYTMRHKGRWSDLRSVLLGERGAAEALLEVKEMAEREAALER